MAATQALLTKKKQLPLAVRAGKRITRWSKALSIILAASAEPLMRYTTIYLALATALPVIKVDALYSACQGVVIAAPEFVIIGAFNIADEELKRKDGQRTWGWILRMICLLMSLIMIATFVDIFIVRFDELALKLLNFARCLIAVGFTVTLGKLDRDDEDEESAASANTQPATTNGPASASSQATLDQALAKLKDELLQQIRVEVRSHIHVAEVVEAADRTSLANNLLPTGNRTATAETGGQDSESERTTTAKASQSIGHESDRTAESEQDSDRSTVRTATAKVEKAGENKLDLTLDFLRENPGRAISPDIDALLAAHLGLNRPASARFWRLKAQELLDAEAGNKSNDQGAFARVLAYVQTHEPTTQREVAGHLGITERTVRRHFAALRASGQLPITWTRNEEDNNQVGGQESTTQPIGQPTPESDPSNERTEDSEEQDSESMDNVVLFRHAAR
ncbi:hypothetical protein KSF_048530 [Reticulibacter mediterranei]|uniref:Helix-turn-helix type 11 domain-containing protein n=1 Tax=Reticulibacter mediterranei TaxID=2778369 RepID=A0A8J3ILT9_9CHLR|nr:HTH domain-containing protein [Reticulibacter mediterranei]GHO94805.1 hypothetical protein KSF_048530 [Reticulibacter mediterranei]